MIPEQFGPNYPRLTGLDKWRRKDMFTSDEWSEYGPNYPKLTGLDKWRKKATLTSDEWREYGAAVRKKIEALNRSALVSVTPSRQRCPCASGSWSSDPKEIAKAVKRQNQAAFDAAVARDRAKRTDDEIREAYATAMREKNETR